MRSMSSSHDKLFEKRKLTVRQGCQLIAPELPKCSDAIRRSLSEVVVAGSFEYDGLAERYDPMICGFERRTQLG
jgi:hypothetical protein